MNTIATYIDGCAVPAPVFQLPRFRSTIPYHTIPCISIPPLLLHLTRMLWHGTYLTPAHIISPISYLKASYLSFRSDSMPSFLILSKPSHTHTHSLSPSFPFPCYLSLSLFTPFFPLDIPPCFYSYPLSLLPSFTLILFHPYPLSPLPSFTLTLFTLPTHALTQLHTPIIPLRTASFPPCTPSSFPPLHSTPLHSTPLHSTPYHTTPYNTTHAPLSSTSPVCPCSYSFSVDLFTKAIRYAQV